MGFGQLGYLWTAILPVMVLLYYFFRKKYTERTISSTMFWETVMKETKVSPYLQHLQRNALFYLQMLALLLFVFAMIQPFLKTKALAGEQIIWVVDTSATMLAKQNGETVFDAHKREMIELTKQLAGKPLTLITTGEEPTILLRDETNASIIQSTISKLEVQYEQEQLPKMLTFTESLLTGEETSVYLFTDHVERSELPLENEDVTWFVKGAKEGLRNVSILRFGATKTEKFISALVQLSNDTSVNQPGTLEIISTSGKVLITEKVDIPAKDTLSISFKELPLTDGLTARIKVSDDYAIDNENTIMLHEQTSQTYVDGSLHQLISAAFQAMDIPVSTVPTEQLATLKEQAIVVTNQTNRLVDSDSPVLLIGRNDEKAIEINGVISIESDEVFAYADMKDIFVSSVYPPFDEFETIARVDNQPFIQRSTNGDIVILTDIQMTDWPLHPSFPLFLWSAREQISSNGNYIGVFSPKERKPISLLSEEGDREWEIFSEQGDYITSIQNGGQFEAPRRPGLYVIKSGTNEKEFSVALHQQEKKLDDGTTFVIGSSSENASQQTVRSSMVPWFILVIVLLMLAEWEVQRRRGFTN